MNKVRHQQKPLVPFVVICRGSDQEKIRAVASSSYWRV